MSAITDTRLKELERAELKLQALEAGGVQNWDNYDDALEEYRATVELDEKREAFLYDITVALGEGAYEPSERGAGVAFSIESELACIEIMQHYGVRFG